MIPDEDPSMFAQQACTNLDLGFVSASDNDGKNSNSEAESDGILEITETK